MATAENRAGTFTKRALIQALVLLPAGSVARRSFARSATQDPVSVRDFGATGDNSDTDAARIQAAIDSVKVGGVNEGRRVLFPEGGTYVCDRINCSGLQNVELVGYGATITGPSTGRVGCYFDLSGSADVVIEGFAFDGRAAALPAYTQADFAANNLTYNTPVIANGETAAWSNITVRNCTLTGMYTNAVWAYRGSGVTVENNVFSAPVCTQTWHGTPAAQQYIFVMLQTVGGQVSVTGNRFLGSATTNPALPPCGVFYSGITGPLLIANNRADYCARDNTGTHRLGVFDGYGDSRDVTIESNVCTNVMAQFGRMSATAAGKVLNNAVHWSPNCEAGYNGFSVESTVVFGGQKGCQDILIEGNTFDDPAARHAMAIGLLAYDWGAPLTDIRVIDNVFRSGGAAIKTYGPYYNLIIEGNQAPNASGTFLEVGPTPPGSRMTSVRGTEANATYDRLFVRRNLFRDTIARANGIHLGLGARTRAHVGLTVIEDNDLESTGGLGHAVVLIGRSTNMTRNEIIVRGNRIRGFADYAYFRDGGRYIWQDNDCEGATVTDYNDGGGYLSLELGGARCRADGARSSGLGRHR